MKWFQNRKIGTQLIASFIIVALIAGLTGGIGIYAISNLNGANKALYEESTLSVDKASEIMHLFLSTEVKIRDAVLVDAKEQINELLTEIDQNQAELQIVVREMDDMIADPLIRESLDAYKADMAAYDDALTNISGMARNNVDTQALMKITSTLEPISARNTENIETLITGIKAQAALRSAESQDLGILLGIVMAGTVLAAIILSILIGILISRMIGKPIKKSLEMLEEMTKGRLNSRLNLGRTNEIGQMAENLDRLADYLQNVIIAAMNKISRGDIDIQLEVYDDLDEITPALKTTVETIDDLLKKTIGMVDAVAQGDMQTRIDVAGLQGDWQRLGKGVNSILDEISAPVSEASMVMTKMAEGNLKIRITGDYKGDHDTFIKQPFNAALESLSSYVDEISSVLTNMANSDFQQEIQNDYPGDFAPIKTSLNLIIDTFNKVLYRLATSAEQVFAGARQVSDGSQALASGATEQAGSIEQLTASISDVADMTRQNALSANEANELASKTQNSAKSSNQQMKDMLEAMDEINVSSKNISKIIKVIDDIAFQTNILALNAAVEAARAGQHGKGFAVVAEEVRTLAARSASAANETTGLIEGSIKKVELGTKLANETATSLDNILVEIAKSTELISQIAESSDEQASAIGEINEGVDQVSKVTQSNSATAEQSAAASEELTGQADILKAMIEQFKLKEQSKRIKKETFDEDNSYEDDPEPGLEVEKMDPPADQSPDAGQQPILAAVRPKINLTDDEFDKF